MPIFSRGRSRRQGRSRPVAAVGENASEHGTAMSAARGLGTWPFYCREISGNRISAARGGKARSGRDVRGKRWNPAKVSTVAGGRAVLFLFIVRRRCRSGAAGQVAVVIIAAVVLEGLLQEPILADAPGSGGSIGR